jgi:carbon-monoxide dehydrogenase medium subunit
LTASDIDFLAPASVDAAISAIADGDGLVLAGGTATALLLRNRLLAPRRLVHLGRVPDLAGVRIEGNDLRVGAMTTLWDLATDPTVRHELPALATAAGLVGNARVRAVATVGGAVVHGDPRQDLPPVLLAADARVRLVGPRGERELPLRQFLRGFLDTAVEADELVVDILIPRDVARRVSYLRYTSGSYGDYPTVAVAAAVVVGADERVEAARVALAGVGPTTIVSDGAAEALTSTRLGDDTIAAAAAAATRDCAPMSDHRGSAAYRRAVAEVFTKRALIACRMMTR